MPEVGVEVTIPAAGEIQGDGDAFDFREAGGGDVALVREAQVFVVRDGGVDGEVVVQCRRGVGRGGSEVEQDERAHGMGCWMLSLK